MMNLNKCVCILLLIFSFQFCLCTRKYYQNDLEDQLFNLLKNRLHFLSSDSDESTSDEDRPDPYDHIDVDLWNKLNDIEIKLMPVSGWRISSENFFFWFNNNFIFQRRYVTSINKIISIIFHNLRPSFWQ